jgi:Ca2+-binding RTX toxin-like protein
VQSSVTWRLKDNFENLVLTGSADIDGSGNELANVLTGNDGINLLDGGAGADTMAGGLGDDIYVVNAASDRISEAAGQGTDTVRAWVTYRLQDNLETLVLMGSTAIHGTGNGADNLIKGNGSGNVLDGGAGADRMEGGAGNDTYVVDDAGDLVVEAAGGGTDEVRSWVSYTLTANVDNLTLLGTGDLDGTGNGLANTLSGTAGANRLDGGSGADTMYGGAGDDTYVVDAPGDRVIERAGNGYDTVVSSVSHTLSAEVEKLVLTGSAAIDGGGNAAANVLIGNGANNVLDGGLGADAMEGGEGDDTYVVDNAGDVVTELANGGTDLVRSGVSHTLAAHVENLTLTGKANIAATGNELANILTGNAGRNVLDGGLGADVLAGGGGGDTFRFSTALGLDNIDRILAFNHNADTIQLDHDVFAALGAGALAAGAFNLGPVATQADDRVLFDAASKSLSYDADGLGGVDAVKFATIDTLQGGLDHTDFLIV